MRKRLSLLIAVLALGAAGYWFYAEIAEARREAEARRMRFEQRQRDREQQRAALFENIERLSQEPLALDADVYRRDLRSFQRELRKISEWRRMILKGRREANTEAESLAVERLYSLLKDLHVRELPRLRKAFGPVMNRALEEKGISVRVGRPQSVTFTGAPLSNYGSVERFHKKVRDLMKELRFRRAEYEPTSKGTRVYFSYRLSAVGVPDSLVFTR